MNYFTRVLILSTAAVVLALASCKDDKIVYKELKKMEGNLEWKKSDVKTFEITLDKLDEPLDLILTFRCASGFMFRNMLIHMTAKDPQGNQIERVLDVPIKNEQGEFFGEKGFDIVDIEYALELAKTFDAKGIWTYTFRQEMPQMESIDFPMELGLILRRSK
jgi:gliding motility-associated lipoprotein GldH